jgi:hypothetical protein
MVKKIIATIFLVGISFFVSLELSVAAELTILYTGETHAMLYPCNCPLEPDGGVARRATMIKQLRKDNPGLLLLDSGGFFAGGLMDEYTLNTELDMRRTQVNLGSLSLMKYDALAVGDEEFDFGAEFLEENMNKSGLVFLSCNIVVSAASVFKSERLKPYIIKEVNGIKVGIIGLTPMAARQKAQGAEFIEPRLAVKKAVEALKKQGTSIIVLLSHQGESDDLKLIKEVGGIDVVIIGQNRIKEESYTKAGNTLIIKPFWQGRRMGKLNLTIKDNKIADYKIEELRLSDKVSDDPEILSILPRCFSDSHCNEKGRVGRCLEPGTMNSSCLYSKVTKVSLLVITPKNCLTCNTDKTVSRLKSSFLGLVESYMYYPGRESEKLIKDLAINTLPAFLLGKEVEQDKGFEAFRENTQIKGNFFMLNPTYSGLSYFLNRKRIKDRLDLFVSLYDKDIPKLLVVIRDFNPFIHFLAVEQSEADFGFPFSAAKGNIEVEEYLRAVCVQEYYPNKFYDYIICRSKDNNSSWWEDCLGNVDSLKVRSCARSDKGKTLLRENIILNKEIGVMLGPTYLLDNQEIFGMQGIPTKEDFKKILGRD